ncbi:FAR1 DNA-binding domain protein [Medicago truncatula]|uniref:FAR1 DNA-binding domain protein n=1 Tax=Medicago truncatula TaxID=3880 RepID=A0A072THD3_MEDTR|nr:FAR1 DNA-binding domain protein [Medicago truncatula]
MDGRSQASNPLFEQGGPRISSDFEDERCGNNNRNAEEINGDVTGSSDAFEGSHDEPNERYEFVGLDVAYLFYSWFARTSGFSVRKGQMVRDRNGEVVQQTFVCSCQGLKEDRGLTKETRKREPKNETRCECNAKFRVYLDILAVFGNTKKLAYSLLD